MRYIKDLLKGEKLIILIACILSVLLIHITHTLSYNEDCLPSKLSKNIVKKCPVYDYSIIQIRNMFSQFYQQYGLAMMFVNCQQMKKKKLVQIMTTVIFVITIPSTGFTKTVQFDHIFHPPRFISMLFFIVWFGIYGKHKVTILLYRITVATLFILVISVFLSLIVENLKEYNPWTQLIIQYLNYFIKKIVAHQIKQRIKQKMYYEDLVLIQILYYI